MPGTNLLKGEVSHKSQFFKTVWFIFQWYLSNFGSMRDLQKTDLLPFKYRVPFPRDAIYGGVGEFLSDSKAPAKLLEAFNVIKAHYLKHQDLRGWDIFIAHYLDFSRNRYASKVVRDDWSFFSFAVSDPVVAYERMMLSFSDSILPFQGIPATMVMLVDDILRDGVITPHEEAFLNEKRLEMGVGQEELTWLLEIKRLQNSTLVKLVHHACEDGVVTPTERAYLHERGTQFNCSTSEINFLIFRSLYLHYKKEELASDATFRFLTLLLFLCQYLIKDLALTWSCLMTLEDYFCSKKVDSEMATEPPVQKIISVLNEKYLVPKITTLDLQGIEGMAAILNAEQPAQEEIEAAPVTLDGSPLERISMAGHDFEFEYGGNRYDLLVTYRIIGNVVRIQINKEHPFLRGATPKEKSLVQKMAMANVLTQIQMYDDGEVIEEFINQQRVCENQVARLIKEHNRE